MPSLLLVVILLTASFMPPGIRHLHPVREGEGVHHDHGVHEHVSTADHDHRDKRGHEHRNHQESDIAQMDGSRWHFHFHFLGFEVTLPEPVPSERDDESPIAVEWTSLAIGGPALGCPAVDSMSVEQYAPSPMPLAVSEAAFMAAKKPAPPPVSCAPLCDSARRERSGVLRA